MWAVIKFGYLAAGHSQFLTHMFVQFDHIFYFVIATCNAALISHYKNRVAELCQIGYSFFRSINPFEFFNIVQIILVYIQNAVSINKNCFALIIKITAAINSAVRNSL